MDFNRIIWAAMVSSLAGFFALTLFLAPGTQDGSVLNLILPVVAVVDLALSFVVPKLLLAGKTGVEARPAANLIGLALCEAVALMGFVLHLTTGWPYAWTLFLIGGAAMLLHFPRSG